jgi:hypothetical protein
MNHRDIREVLAQELATTAAWRRESATTHPEQQGHSVSASALDRLTLYIRSLPADDPRLLALARLNRDPDFFLIGGEGARELIDQYGAETARAADPNAAGDAFLERLIDASRADEADAEGRRMPPPSDR